MHSIEKTRITYTPGGDSWSLPFFIPEKTEWFLSLVEIWGFQGEFVTPEQEVKILEDILSESSSFSEAKAHIYDISLAESIEKIRTYYQNIGYYQSEINAYTVDIPEARLTFWAHIEHVLYASKDKNHVSYSVPLRSSWDQRTILAGINSWVLIGIHSPTEETIKKLLLDELVAPITLGKALYYNLQARWFEGREMPVSF